MHPIFLFVRQSRAEQQLTHPPTHTLIETCTKTGMVMIFGEISTAATVNYEQVRPSSFPPPPPPPTHPPTSSSSAFKPPLLPPPTHPPTHLFQVIRDTIKEIGYDDPGKGLDYNTMNVIVAIEEQSPDIAQSVDSRTGNVEDIGAGDQGIMFGYVGG